MRTSFMDFNRLDEAETEITVEYSISPYYAATWNDPAEGGEVEIIKAFNETDADIKLTDAEHEKFCNHIAENHDHSPPCDYDE